MKSRHKKILPPKKTLEADRELDARCRVNHESSTAESRGREMKTGGELDVKIATDVLEWNIGPRGGGFFGFDATLATDGFLEKLDKDRREIRRFQPSTQIADAKQVLHKMIDKGYAVEITHDCVAWSVGFTHLDSGRPYFADWKDSLETQICLAALKAFEHG